MSTLVTCIIVVATALLSAGLAGLFFLLIAKRYFANEQKGRLLDMKIDERKETLKVVSPIRLQAYERMALFLERISPNSLILRCYRPGMDMVALQSVLTKTIREEWEHNLSQQVYLSSEAWNRIREAKEEMINLVNASATTLKEGAEPTELAGMIFATSTQGGVPTDSALEFLKAEIKEYFE